MNIKNMSLKDLKELKASLDNELDYRRKIEEEQKKNYKITKSNVVSDYINYEKFYDMIMAAVSLCTDLDIEKVREIKQKCTYYRNIDYSGYYSCPKCGQFHSLGVSYLGNESNHEYAIACNSCGWVCPSTSLEVSKAWFAFGLWLCNEGYIKREDKI